MAPLISSPTMPKWRIWLWATRPKTLPAALSPVLVGTALAYADGAFRGGPALAALGGALLLQIGVNLANDYFDWAKGVDRPGRKGPLRVTQSGLLSPREMRLGIAAVFGLSAAVGLYLVAVGGWPVLAIGTAALLCALLYSGGPFPLGHHGLGDLLVFLFFGIAAVGGTYYVQALRFSGEALLWAVPVGSLITAILVVNNLRDLDTDREAGKRTLAVRLGERGSRWEYGLLLLTAYGVPLGAWLAGVRPAGVLLPWLSFPLAVRLLRTMAQTPISDGSTLNRALTQTAQLSLAYSALLALGLGSLGGS